MTAGFLIFRYPLLRVIQTPEDTFTGTMSYITVILDILFMGKLHFGVQSAAVATIAAQAVSVILCLSYQTGRSSCVSSAGRILLLYSAFANRAWLSPDPVSFLFQ